MSDDAIPRRIDHDARIVALAARQHGVVTRAQLLAAGAPAHAIDYRVEKGRLERLHSGVYRVGPLRAPHERNMAAVLACGATAVLSHRSAAAAWDLLPRPTDDPVAVSVRRGRPTPGPAVRVHRVSDLHRDETTVREGIPITTPARTILDVAASAGTWEIEQAVARAERAGLADSERMKALLARHPRRPGTRALRALLIRATGPAFTRSEAESRFLGLVRRARLPSPESNVRVKGWEVDFLWRRERLIVEIDGFAYHSSARAFERDRLRDGVLAAAGYRVVRCTWRQLTREPEALLVRIAQALARSRTG